MKLQRKALIRNAVIAMIVADGVGVYFLQDRLTNPLQDSAAAYEQEALALAASEAATPQVSPPKPAEALASRELPKPAFGMDAPVKAETAKVEPVKAAAPRAAAAPALAKAPAVHSVAAPVAKAAVKAAPVNSLAAKRTIIVPRAVASASTKTPVTLSVTHSSKVAKASGHKRTSFTNAFAGISRSAPALAMHTASGSLQHAGPTVTADFAPDSTVPQVEIMETVPLAMASQPDMMSDQAPTMSAPTQSASVELPATGE
ncbi:hypothetical protein [Novosphingobium sp.]|uniref:hypothetical protein n=1 Tax=Novosphingobium sp. TaxID=1874826 RepID=UPI00286E6E8B|nr:hypothetical protein [Novosphingobium sp.]